VQQELPFLERLRSRLFHAARGRALNSSDAVMQIAFAESSVPLRAASAILPPKLVRLVSVVRIAGYPL